MFVGGDARIASISLETDPLLLLSNRVLNLDSIVRRHVYLQSGQIYVSSQPSRVVTTLGSCVAVCLFDPSTGVGGVNHYLLPTGPKRSPRFGTHAISQLIDEVLALGARRSTLQAKVFGGACVLSPKIRRNVGAKNVALALSMLKEQKIEIVDQDVAGCSGRKLIFDTDVGVAWVRRL